jgi:hypothetical protein
MYSEKKRKKREKKKGGRKEGGKGEGDQPCGDSDTPTSGVLNLIQAPMRNKLAVNLSSTV